MGNWGEHMWSLMSQNCAPGQSVSAVQPVVHLWLLVLQKSFGQSAFGQPGVQIMLVALQSLLRHCSLLVRGPSPSAGRSRCP